MITAVVFHGAERDKTTQGISSAISEEIADPTGTEQSKALLDTMSDYDIVSSPDPTSSVLVVQIPQFSPHYAEPDDSGDV